MTDWPSLSIIIPVYQVADYIVACLESVASQEYPGKVEIIIVDDCGTDNSMALAKEFVRQYRGPFSFSIYSHPVNKGLSAARNTGMEHATGDFLLFVDSDDSLLPNALINLTAPLDREVFDVIVGGDRHRISEPIYGASILREYVLDHIPVVAWNKLYRRQMIVDNALSFCEGVIYEDELWSFQIAHLAQSLFLTTENTYLYTRREGSIMTSDDTGKKVNSLRTIIDEMQFYSSKNGLLDDIYVCLRIDYLKIRILNELFPDITRFFGEYIYLRKTNPLKWIDYFKAAGLHPLKQIRCFHYALPPKLGALCLYHRVRRTKRQK